MKIKKDIFKSEENTSSGIRINKYLADSGICSRREADAVIEKGRITVDGIKATLGTRVLEEQTVCLDGQPIEPKDKLVLIAFNKPVGIISTTDRRVDDNIIDYIDHKERIFPIGRLDKDSSGLILLTNDGDIVNKILRCGNRHEKEYEVEVNKVITKEFIKAMSSGVPILDTVTLPCTVKQTGERSFTIILTQGLNRQIRRMCEALGYRVLALKRVRIMNINLGRLKEGSYRALTPPELEGLKDLIADSKNAPSDLAAVRKPVGPANRFNNSNKRDFTDRTDHKPSNRQSVKQQGRQPDRRSDKQPDKQSKKLPERRSDKQPGERFGKQPGERSAKRFK
ncbi:MAG: 23S rRNA pseudouridine(2604) synthase RluF [Lachnospiraceae bacterium]|nr:23S rRNA pseudouridine(2604) synthase RluF [Lachnospiraceae bacterium]